MLTLGATLRLFIGAAAVPALTALALLGPWSPLAVERAADKARAGDAEAALGDYRDISNLNPWAQHRAAALYDGAMLASAEVGRERLASHMLKRFTQEHPGHPLQAEATARLASLWVQDVPLRAAKHWTQAAELSPEHPQAAEWRLESARALESAGVSRQAWSTLEQLSQDHPDYAPQAGLAMARLRLQAGDAEAAQELYARVLAEPAQGELHAIARLGLSMALEDLGQHQAAVAELEALNDPSVELRRERVRERNWARLR